MIREKTRKANVAAAIWFLSAFASIFPLVLGDGSNTWDLNDNVADLIAFVVGASYLGALWFYAQAKGYSGFVGVGLAFLFVIGLIILLVLPDKTKLPAVNELRGGLEQHPTIDPVASQGNYFVRLFNGDVPLVVTCWVWGALFGGLVFGGIFATIQLNYAAIAVMPYGFVIFDTFYWLSIAYMIFLWVAVWRSAGKYQGAYWGVVARAMVVFGAGGTLGNAIAPQDDEAARFEEVRQLNASLPTMLNEITRLDSVSYDGNSVTFFATIVDGTAVDYDPELFRILTKFSAASAVCSRNESRAHLEEGIAYKYTYVDMYDSHIADVVVTDEDCDK